MEGDCENYVHFKYLLMIKFYDGYCAIFFKVIFFIYIHVIYLFYNCKQICDN
jgi:hypothetical protein